MAHRHHSYGHSGAREGRGGEGCDNAKRRCGLEVFRRKTSRIRRRISATEVYKIMDIHLDIHLDIYSLGKVRDQSVTI